MFKLLISPSTSISMLGRWRKIYEKTFFTGTRAWLKLFFTWPSAWLKLFSLDQVHGLLLFGNGSKVLDLLLPIYETNFKLKESNLMKKGEIVWVAFFFLLSARGVSHPLVWEAIYETAPRKRNCLRGEEKKRWDGYKWGSLAEWKSYVKEDKTALCERKYWRRARQKFGDL